MRERLSRAERAQRTRDAIVVAVVEAVAARGVRGMRVEDVASRAGVSTPLLYYHFRDRLTLLRAALDYANAQAPSGVLRGDSGDGRNGYDAIRDALQREFDETPTIRHSSIVWNEVSATAVFEPEMRPDLIRVTHEWNAWVTDAIAAGIADGSIRDENAAADAAELLTAVVEGLSLRWLAQSIDRERAQQLLDIALAAILAR
jgi:AcrR family transcriptional regulator